MPVKSICSEIHTKGINFLELLNRRSVGQLDRVRMVGEGLMNWFRSMKLSTVRRTWVLT